MAHPGMWDDFLRAGSLQGCELEISRENFEAVQGKYLKPGLGTALHAVLAPVVAVLDAVAGTGLADCGGCAERELKLNR